MVGYWARRWPWQVRAEVLESCEAALAQQAEQGKGLILVNRGYRWPPPTFILQNADGATVGTFDWARARCPDKSGRPTRRAKKGLLRICTHFSVIYESEREDFAPSFYINWPMCWLPFAFPVTIKK